MRPTLEELRNQAARLDAELEELRTADTLTDEQEARYDEAIAEVAPLVDQIQAAETREAQIARIKTVAKHSESGDGTRTAPVPGARDRNLWDLAEARTAAGDNRKRYATEVRTRAVEAIDTVDDPRMTDAHRQAATELVQRNANPGIAEHILSTGSPEYRELFEEYIGGDPTALVRYRMNHPHESRAAMSLTGANGGFMVPFTLDPTIILTNAGATNPFRGISTVKTITTDDWNGVSSAGVTAEWLAEATEAADASPTVAQPSITVHKAAAYIQASLEVTMDAGIATEIGGLIADAKDRLEATAFATGSGSGQPFGIVTALGLTTASRVAGSSGAAGAADLVAADIFALDNDLGPRYRPNASFVANKATWNAVRRLSNVNAGNNPASFWVDFGAGLPSTLIGYPVYESSAMDSTVVSGSNDDVIILGDFRDAYFIVDRVGLAIAFNPLVLGSNRRPSGEVGWFAYWRVGGDSVNDAAFRMLRL